MKWLSLEDYLPPRECYVLVTDGENIGIGRMLQREVTVFDRYDKNQCPWREITHWCHLHNVPLYGDEEPEEEDNSCSDDE